MDSKVVNKAIRSEVRPLLAGAGFASYTARTFWRYRPDRVDVVNFQSFNSYNAGVLDITTYSYAVNLGCYLRYIPNQYPAAPGVGRLKGDKPKPKEYDCHMRARLARSYSERTCSDAQIWFIDSRGSNLDKALHDTRMVLNRDGLPWFEQFASPGIVYDILIWELVDDRVMRPQQLKAMWVRSVVTLCIFGVASIVALGYPLVGLGMCIACLIVYLRPAPPAAQAGDMPVGPHG